MINCKLQTGYRMVKFYILSILLYGLQAFLDVAFQNIVENINKEYSTEW